MSKTIPAPDENQFSVGTTTNSQAVVNTRTIAAPAEAESETPSEDNPILDAYNSIKSFGIGMKQAVTGEGTELEFPDVKELTEIDDNSVGFWESLPVNLKLSLVRGNQQKAEVLENSFKGDERFGGIFSDKHDNPMVVWNKQPYYLNKPGLSGQDWQTFAGELLKYLPATKYVSSAKRTIGTFVRGLPTYTATELAGSGLEAFIAPEATERQQKTVTDVGKEALKIGGLSAGVEAALPPVVRGIARGVKSVAAPTTAFVAPHISKFAGDLKTSFADVIEATTGTPRPPVSQSKYPLTQGQRTSSPPLGITPTATRQIEEEDILRQAPSASPKESGTQIIRAFDENQLLQIRNDAIALQDEFGSGTASGSRATDEVAGRVPEAAAEGAQDVVSGAAADLKRRSSEAYKAVRQADDAPVMTPQGVYETINRIRNTVVGTSDDSMGIVAAELADMPILKRELEYFDRIFEMFTKRAGAGFTMAGSKDIPLRQLHAYQKRLNRSIKAAGPGTPEALALSKMKRELDSSIYKGIDEGFIYGDEAILKELRSATDLYRNYMRLTGQGAGKGPRGRANSILQKLSDKDWDAPKLANTLFGHAKFNPAQSIRMVIDDLKSILPEEQYDEVMRHLKDAVLEKAFTNPKGEIRRTAIHNNYNQIFVKNKQIAEALFSPEEIGRIKEFRKNVMPTLWAEMKLNPSGSGYVALGGLARAGLLSTPLRVATGIPLVGETAKVLQGTGAVMAARDAVSQYLRRNQHRWITIPTSAMTRTMADDVISPEEDINAPVINNLLQSLSPSGKAKLENLQQ